MPLNFKFTDNISNGVVPVTALMHPEHLVGVILDTSAFLRTPKVLKMEGRTPIETGFSDIDPDHFLLGPLNANMKVTGLPVNKVIFDYITKKPFSDFIVDTTDTTNTTIFLGADTFNSKILVSSDSEGNKTLLNPSPRFPYDVNGSGSAITPNAAYPDSTALFIKNPLTKFECYVPQNSKYTSWKPRFRVCQELIGDTAIEFSGGRDRHSIVTAEKVKVVKDKLIQLEERDVIENSWDFNKTGIIIESYDLSRGLLLLKNPVPKDLLVTYRVDQTKWKEINIDTNPLVNELAGPLELHINIDSEIMHYKTSKNTFLHSASTDDEIVPSLIRPDLYKKVAQINFKPSEINLIDVRQSGGMLDKENIDTTSYDLNSHTNYGFMGVNPTQLNAVAVHLPDSVLQNLITQFSDNPGTDGWDWDTKRITYINFLRSTIWQDATAWDTTPLDEDDLLNENPIKDEVLQNVTRHLAAGVVALVYDTQDSPNLIYISNK